MRKCNLIGSNKDKLFTPRKINLGFYPVFMWRNCLAMIMAKEAEATKQTPTPVQPAEAPATQSLKSP